MSKSRRSFLKGATSSAAALLGTEQVADAQQANAPATAAPSRPPSPQPEPDPHETVEVMTAERPGADFMTDLIKGLGFEYVCANPGSSFRALHESIVNYGSNRAPEFITCCHEESSIAMAHGYAKIEGKPLCVFAHGTVGLQHAAMAIFNAFCDRVPIYIVLGNSLDATQRRPGVEWAHSVQDAAAMVRDYIKWDDLPVSLPHFAESAIRAYKIAMTPPMLPVMIVADSDLQETPIAADANLRIPKLTLARPPQGDSDSVDQAARWLVAAETPVLIADRAARTANGMKLLVQLAETLQAPVVDRGGRMNFPNRHPLCHTERGRALIANADVILGLELTDFWGLTHSFRDQLHRSSRALTKTTAKVISITATDLYLKSNYQDFQRYPEVDLAIAADAEATLPSLIEAVKRHLTPDRKNALTRRGAKLAADRQESLNRSRADASYAWDASPISTARLCAELWQQIKDKDWSLVSSVNNVSDWPLRLWDFDEYHRFIGGSGGAGVGYGAPAALGAALANRKHGRLTVNIQNDGDLMYAPGVLWTAAHHRIPILNIMHNNRAYHQETMHLQRMGNRHNRGVTQAGIGTTLTEPNIDFGALARSLGIHGEGPITDPNEVGPAIRRATAMVERGVPALVDVVTQPR